MVKIIITRPFMENGGVAQFVNNLSPYFSNKVRVFKRGKRKQTSKIGYIFPIVGVFRFFWFIIRIKPKKIIINTSLANVGLFRDGIFVFISKVLNIKTILFIHGFDQGALARKTLLKYGYFKADKIFVLSSTFKDLLKQLGYFKPIMVSYNPISIELIEKSKDLRRGLEINNGVRILMMSRIVKSKGIFIGLEIMKDFQKQNIELHIAGTGPDLELAKDYVKENKLTNVRFHGFISGEEKNDLLRKSDILLFPTYHNEGLPINILESLAMNLCVITRPIAGIIDLSQCYQLFLNDSLDSDDFKNIICQLKESGIPENEINKNRLKAIVDFSPKTIFDKVVMSS